MNSLLPQRIEGVPTPRNADEQTLRLCLSETDAVIASITLSGLTLEEIGNRCGVSKQAVDKWKRQGLPSKRTRAFMNATGTRLVEQWRALDAALKQTQGVLRERDRFAAMVAPTQKAWGVAA